MPTPGWSSASTPVNPEILSDDEKMSENEIFDEIENLKRLKARLSPSDAYLKSVSIRLQQLERLLY